MFFTQSFCAKKIAEYIKKNLTIQVDKYYICNCGRWKCAGRNNIRTAHFDTLLIKKTITLKNGHRISWGEWMLSI